MLGLALFMEMQHEPDEVVLVLWRLLRRAETCASADGEPRDSAGLSLSLAETSVISRAVVGRDAAEADGEPLEAIATWLEERGYLRASVASAELASYCAPYAAKPAIEAGRLCRRLGEYDRAEAWYSRAAGLARLSKDWESYIQVLLWHGFLHFQRGDYREAERKYRSAGRYATRYGRRIFAGMAHHNLLTIASDLGLFDKGVSHAAKALSLYPVHYPRVPHLVHDYAFLLARHAYFAVALPLLEAVYPHISAPHERVVVLGNIARAAGGARNVTRFHEAVTEVADLVSRSEENASRGLLGLADGAHSLGLLSEAIAFGDRAVEIAERRGDSEVIKLATEIVSSATRGERGRVDRGPVDRAENLAHQCLHRVERWTARPRGQAAAMLRKHSPKRPSPSENAASTGWRRPAS